MLPSTLGSSTPVTVTVCATFQLALVNVSAHGSTPPSDRSRLVNPTVTFTMGWLVSPTLNFAFPSPSVVVSPQVGFTVFFFNDTATTEIYTLSLLDALPISSVLVAGAVTIV